VKDVCDFFERKAQFPEHKDHAQLLYGGFIIEPVTGLGDMSGMQQTNGVIVVQRPDTDTRQPGYFLYGFHRATSLSKAL
jgi:hypothetical protein